MVGKSNVPVLRPSRKDFSKPFTDYISSYFSKHPDVPIIKVVPPAGYRPRRTRSGYYDCVLMAKPSLTVEEFREVAEKRGEPKPSDDADELHERKFWKALGVNPPLYGADTPQSLFDEEVEFGWNLRDLGCLLHRCDVPDIPGVTTPMTYFGMWRSFFSWHVEDVDLLSINYLHYGAPKVWYAIPPGEPRKRFERMAQGLFPDAARNCPNFLRHKTVMITTTLLHDNNIPYVTVKHNPGEFVVLNAGAYHAGFNQGFNCAEAVNFATEEWIPLGKQATRCRCKALGKDAVRVDMNMFPGGQDTSSEDDNSSEDEDSEAESVESDEGSSNAPNRRRGLKKKIIQKLRAKPVVAKRGPGRPRKDTGSDSKLKAKAAAMKVKAAAKQVNKGKSRRTAVKEDTSSDEAGSQVGKQDQQDKQRQPSGRQQPPQEQQRGGEPAPANPRKRRGHPSEEEERQASKKARTVPGETAKRKVGRPRKALQASDTAALTQEPTASRGTGALAGPMPGVRVSAQAGELAQGVQHNGEPFLIVGRNESTGARFFYLVQMLQQAAKAAGEVRVRWLEQQADGLYHPSSKEWDEPFGALSKVRTQKCSAKKGGHLCYKLLTLRSKIEAVELED